MLNPTCSGPHLTEYLAREFAHTHGGLNVTVARVGMLSISTLGPAEQNAVGAVRRQKMMIYSET